MILFKYGATKSTAQICHRDEARAANQRESRPHPQPLKIANRKCNRKQYKETTAVLRSHNVVCKSSETLVCTPISQSAIPISQSAIPISQSAIPISQSAIPISQSAIPISQSAICYTYITICYTYITICYTYITSCKNGR